MSIRFFDMFSGIGGFRSGLEAVGGFECIGHCEIDKHANQAYNAIYDIKPQEVYFEDARKINPYDLPHIDLICGGFPCQAFSIAGKRGGFDDARGTLFFEIARIAAVKRPSYLLLENVPGLLSHDGGRTFATILGALSDLGYDVTWEVLNSKDFGVPQSRKRVYLIGYLDERCRGKIFPFTETAGTSLVQILPGAQGSRIYSPNGVSCTLTSQAGGMGGKTGLYEVGLPIKENTKKGYKMAYPGDSISLAFAGLNTRRGRVGRKIAHTLTTNSDQGTLEARAVLTPERETVRQNGRRIKSAEEPMFTLTAQDRHGVFFGGRIRRLTPKECLRLQGWRDEQIDRVLPLQSDAQLYKQAGNGVTVTVVEAIGKRLASAHREVNAID